MVDGILILWRHRGLNLKQMPAMCLNSIKLKLKKNTKWGNYMPKEGYRVPMVANAILVLDELAVLKEATFTEIVNNCNLNKASAKRILVTLLAEGVIDYDSTKRLYKLGMKVLKWGRVVVDFFELGPAGRRILERLRNDTNETVFIVERRQYHHVCIEKYESHNKMRICSDIGVALPLTYGPGKLILAFMETEELEEYLQQQMFQYTDHTVTKKEEVISQLAEIHQRGYFIDMQEFIDGITGISAPLFNYRNKIIGAVSLVAPLQRLSENDKMMETIAKVVEAGKEISIQFGYSPQ